MHTVLVLENGEVNADLCIDLSRDQPITEEQVDEDAWRRYLLPGVQLLLERGGGVMYVVHPSDHDLLTE